MDRHENIADKGLQPYFYTMKEVDIMTEQEIYVKRIMLEKLEEMSEIKFDDCADNEYHEICKAMNEIAKTILGIT